MIITFELLNTISSKISVNIDNNNVFDIKLYLKNKYNLDNIIIYEENTKLNDDFINWNTTNNYYIYIESDIFISLQLNTPHKIITTPYFNINTPISIIKNILSINNDLYFNNVKLNNNKTLSDYNINNNSNIFTYADSAVSCAV